MKATVIGGVGGLLAGEALGGGIGVALMGTAVAISPLGLILLGLGAGAVVDAYAERKQKKFKQQLAALLNYRCDRIAEALVEIEKMPFGPDREAKIGQASSELANLKAIRNLYA